VLAEAADQAHLIEAIHGVLGRLGGTARVWRTDRLSTVIVPGRRDVQPSFAPVAKHYGAVVEPCPPRRGNRKGSVESSVRYVCGRWWRTMIATTVEAAQASLDRFCVANATVAFRGSRYSTPPGLAGGEVALRLGDGPRDRCRRRHRLGDVGSTPGDAE
jgi:hypothetical protein